MYNSHVYWYWVHLFDRLPIDDKDKIILFKLMLYEFIDMSIETNKQ